MNSRIDSLLQDAAQWRLLSLLFECPSAEWRSQVEAVASEVRDPQLQAAAASALAEAAEGVYHSILGPGGPAPAREVSYHDTVQLGYLMSELTTYYSAFAYGPTTAEALDHVSVESGFMGFLRLKEAFALAGEDDEAASVAAEAAQSFVADHLSNLAQPLAGSLAASGIEYLEGAGQALFTRVGPRRTLPVIENLCGEAFCSEASFDCGAASA